METTTLARDRVFSILELLREIFEQLVDTRPVQQGGVEVTIDRLSLRNAALCCHTFSEPALDALWKDLRSWRPLKWLLPTIKTSKGVEMLQEKFDKKIWARFLVYAQRVRSVRFSSTPLLDDTNLHNDISRLLDGKPLLPALETFKWNFGGRGTNASLNFITPSLKIVQIYSINRHYARNPTVASFVEKLATDVPRLEALSVNGVELPSPLPTPGFPALQRLTCSPGRGIPVSPRAYQEYAGFGTLRTIKLYIRDLELKDLVPGFPQLECLVVYGTASLSAALIKNLLSPNLKEVDVQSRLLFDTEEDCKLLLEQLQRFLLTLEAITFIANFPSHTRSIPLLSFANPVLRHSNIRHLTLEASDYPSGISVTNSDVDHICRSFGKLETLKLPPATNDKRPTLDCLENVVEHCPRLKVLSISLDASKLPAAIYPSRAITHDLQTLQSDFSPIFDPDAVASYLLSLFPSLQFVTCSHEVYEYQSRWEQVQRLITERRSITRVLAI